MKQKTKTKKPKIEHEPMTCFVCKGTIGATEDFIELPKSIKYPNRIYMHINCRCFSKNWNEMRKDSPLVKLWVMNKKEIVESNNKKDSDRIKWLIGLVKYINHMSSKKPFPVYFAVGCESEEGVSLSVVKAPDEEPFIKQGDDFMSLLEFINLKT